MAGFQLVMYIQKFIMCHCILMIEGRGDWKKNTILHVWSNCFLPVWDLLILKGHSGSHAQLCLGSFTLLCKERRAQQLKCHGFVPRIHRHGPGPYILPFLWYTERHCLSHPVSGPSFLLAFFLSIVLVDTSVEGANPPPRVPHEGTRVKASQKESVSLGVRGPTWPWERRLICHRLSKVLKSTPERQAPAYVVSECDL